MDDSPKFIQIHDIEISTSFPSMGDMDGKQRELVGFQILSRCSRAVQVLKRVKSLKQDGCLAAVADADDGSCSDHRILVHRIIEFLFLS